MKIRAVLPWPPSVNHYWMIARNRMYITKRGKDYKKHIALLFLQQFGQHYTPHAGPIRLEIGAVVPDGRKRDIDNIQKALLDALGNAGLFVDDSQIVEVLIRKYPKHEQYPDGAILLLAEDCETLALTAAGGGK